MVMEHETEIELSVKQEDYLLEEAREISIEESIQLMKDFIEENHEQEFFNYCKEAFKEEMENKI